MKKAIIDQILLGLFLFVGLIVLGATISDNMEARDKYYNLKKITDNAVLTLAKYYVNIEDITANAQNTYYEMLKQTKLGNEVKDTIYYSWDFISEPNTVTATIDTYKQDTFWFKLLGLASFDLKASSKATITTTNLLTPTSEYSNGIAPFAVNDQNFTIGQQFDIDYAQTYNWQYTDKDTFYPVVTECDCDCSFILSNKFDFAPLFDVDNCDASSAGCTTQGGQDFTQYAKEIYATYNSKQSINFINGKTSSPICLLGEYLGNDTSNLATEISALARGIYDIIGNSGENLPLEMDLITLNDSGIANGIVRVQITGYDIVTISNPSNQYIKLHTEVVPAKTQIIELVE